MKRRIIEIGEVLTDVVTFHLYSGVEFFPVIIQIRNILQNYGIKVA